jgi:hypothetical protein
MTISVSRGHIHGCRMVSCRTLCVLIACLVCPGIAHSTDGAATYYVDAVRGTDRAPGTADAPWKTIDKVASSSHSGDAIHIVTIDAGIFRAKWPEGRTYYAPGVTQFGITWTFRGDCRVGQFANQDIWVLGPVTIVAITPASTNEKGRIKNGSMVNPSPTVIQQGYDSAMAGNIWDANLNVAYNVSETAPLVLPSGSSLVSTISVAAVVSTPPQLSSAAILTVLSSAPADGSFRPPYSGSDKSIKYNKKDLDYSLLASLAPVAGTPSLSTVEGYFERPWIDHQPGWSARYQHPAQNMPDYGREIGSIIGIGAQMLHLNFTNAQKETLMIRFVQLGIDLYGVASCGERRIWWGAAGQGTGRKWPILFAGLVLNDAGMKAIAAKSGDYLYSGGYGPGNVPPDYFFFGEDDQTHYVTQLDVDLTDGPAWSPDSRDTVKVPYSAADIGMPEWGIWHEEYPERNNNVYLTQYRDTVGCVLSGLVLPALIMNAEGLWNHDALFDYTDRWMMLTAKGAAWEIGNPWRAYNDFSEHMWDTYRSRYGPVWSPGSKTPGFSLSMIGDQQIAQGQTLTLKMSVTNLDGKELSYSASPLPSGATFSNQTFSWTPTAGQVGSYQVTFTVSDGQSQDSETITITVTAPNHAPVLGAIGGKSVRENESLSFSVSATDADAGDSLSYSATGLPSGAEFSGGTFRWQPEYDQAGSYQVTFVVSDGRDQDSETVTIVVANVNRPPVMNELSDRSIDAGNSLEFGVSAIDPDGDSLTYSADGVPAGASFTGHTFTWTPGADQGGSYPITFTVSDGDLQGTRTVTITVVPPQPDTTAPVVARCTPEPDAIQVPLNNLVTLHITDAGRGVDGQSVVIRVNGDVVYQGNVAVYTSDYGRCSRSGAHSDYRYIYQSGRMFDFDQTVTVTVSAADLQGNAMSAYSYSYTTEMRTFGSNKRVSKGVSDKDGAAIVRDTVGNLWAAWHEGEPGRRDIYVAKLSAGAEAFGNPIRLTTDAADQCNPDLAAGGDGKLYVVWQDNRRGNWDIFASVCSDRQKFSREVRISDSNDNEVNPSIAVDHQSPNRVWVAWQDDRHGNQDIYVASSTNSFAASVLSQITTDMANQTDPDLTVDSANHVYVVWTDARNGQADIYGAVSDSGPWTNVPVVTAPGDQTDPAVAAEPDGSVLHLLWVSGPAGRRDIYYASSAGLPGSPLTGRDIIDDTSGADQAAPAIACSTNHRAFACWQDSRHVGSSGDTDLYYAEVSPGAAGTNVLVGDDNSNTGQHQPAIGVDSYGQPCMVWTDDRDSTQEIYYAAATFIDPDPLDSKLVAASTGATIGTDPAEIDQADDVSIVVPARACPTDLRITISRILNPQIEAVNCLGSYDFGPSGVDFDLPVTVTVPYALSNNNGHRADPYWYDSLTGALSQQGITEVENIVVNSKLNALRFKTTHFTPFYVVASDSGVNPAGRGGGGCSLSVAGGGSPAELVVPYALIALVMVVLRRRDNKRHGLMKSTKP